MLMAFESSRRGNEVRVWRYCRSGAPVELNVTKIGVEKDFYGNELDERITKLETGFASLAEELRNRNGLINRADIGDLVAHLSLRTRALRQSGIELATKMADRVRDHFSQPEVLKAAARRRLTKAELLQRLRQELANQGLKRVEIEKRIFAAGPKLVALWEQKLNEGAEEMAPVVDRVMREGAKGLPASMRVSFIEALSRGLDDNPRVLAYRRFNWFVLPTADSLILGDCVCVFETDGDRTFKPWDDEASPGKRILMPLAPGRLLIGAHESEMPDLDIPAVNQVFARCSLEFLVSARRLVGPEAQMLDSLGTWSGIASDGDLNAIWEQIKDDFWKSGEANSRAFQIVNGNRPRMRPNSCIEVAVPRCGRPNRPPVSEWRHAQNGPPYLLPMDGLGIMAHVVNMGNQTAAHTARSSSACPPRVCS